MHTQLADRKLWFDGDSTVSPERIVNLIKQGISPVGLFVDSLTPDIIQYNKMCMKQERIEEKESERSIKLNWNLPSKYADLDVSEYIATPLYEYSIKNNLTSDKQLAHLTERVFSELDIYEKLDKINVLRTIVYIIDTLVDNNVIWGVGRGSSVSSFVLYLLGVHDVDSYKYDLDFGDFLRL